MRGSLIAALALTTLLLVGFSGTSARAASTHHRHHSAHTRAARRHARTRLHPATNAARRRAALEPRHPTPHTEIAAVPLVRFRMLPPLRGSHESLVRQNQRADSEGLKRVADDQALTAMLESRDLVALPLGPALQVDERLPTNRRFCRLWTANFLTDLARVHYGRFHSPLQVNSAIRTVEYQKHLLLVNGNAAPAEGEIASPHLTGSAVDIGKKGLSPTEIGWMRAYLTPLQDAGKLDVEEEFQQSCFHVTVYNTYATVDGLDPAPPASSTPLQSTARTRRHTARTLRVAAVAHRHRARAAVHHHARRRRPAASVNSAL